MAPNPFHGIRLNICPKKISGNLGYISENIERDQCNEMDQRYL